MYTFLWRLFQLTADKALIQALYRAKDDSVGNLPFDLFADDPEAIQKQVSAIIAGEGSVTKLGSVNKQEWHLAILRSGQGPYERALWLDYDSDGGHGHTDGMNLGLFGWGLDLMPDFGYPPVQFGGWNVPKAFWYYMAAAHNTVVLDGQDQLLNKDLRAGRTTLWVDGSYFRAIRASGPELIQWFEPTGKQFERTVGTVDVSNRDFYVVDVFRVVGGKCHDKFVHSHYGTITPHGLSLKPISNLPIPDHGPNAQMRNFQQDNAPSAGWYVDWSIQDRLDLISKNSDIHLRFTDLTTGAQAFTCEAWTCWYNNLDEVNPGEVWIPRVMVRRQSEVGPLASTFVGVIEPYEAQSNIANIRRLILESANGEAYPDSNVAIEVQLVDGRRDLLIMADVENPLGLSPSVANDRIIVQKEWGVELEGDLCLVRRDRAGKVERVTACSMKYLRIGNFILKLEDKASLIEQTF